MTQSISAGLQRIDAVAAEGELDAGIPDTLDLDIDSIDDPIRLPDGRQIYPPRVHGERLDDLAIALMEGDPSRARFLRLIGPPGCGKSFVARAIAHRMWTRRGKAIERRHDEPFYGFIEMTPGPSSDELFFRHDFVPATDGSGEVRLVDSAFVEAMRNGWLVMIDEVNVARDVALLSINSCLDGRLALYLPSTGETVIAAHHFAVVIAYNNGLVGATDLPSAWHSRFPATVEMRSNWPALIRLGAPERLVRAAKLLDARRFADDGLVWTPQFRDIEALTDMMARVGERAAIAFFVSNIAEQVAAGQIQPAEASATVRMLDEAGYAHLKVPATSRIANLDGYPRAVTG